MIGMTAQIPVVMSLTISIAVFVKTIAHSNHSLKLEFMIAASWSLNGFVFVIPCMTTTGAVGDHRLLYRFRKCCTTKKQTIILFSSFGFTFTMCSHTLLELTHNFGGLTHWGRDKMDAISQTTFSNAFSWMKMCEICLRFHWSLFLRFELTI